MAIDPQKIEYLLNVLWCPSIDEDLCILAEESRVDAQRVAETARKIRLYLWAMQALGRSLPYASPAAYVEKTGFPQLRFAFDEEALGERGDQCWTALADALRREVCLTVEQVLSDDPEDPQYSAVTAHNVAVCYLHLKKELGQTEQTEASGLLAELGWDPHWVRQLEQCREKESVYYVGPQW